MKLALSCGPLALVLAACCGVERPTYLAVPEQIFREPVAAPIDLEDAAGWPAARDRLVAFLRAGGNQDNVEDGTIVVLDAATRYAPLLDAVARPENRDVEDLAAGVYAPWLAGPPVRHVVDARDEAPGRDRHVLFDGDFAWVFTASRRRLVGLTVVRRHDWRREE